MSPEAEQLCESLDAALFNGDTFQDEENLVELIGYLKRWGRWVEEQGTTIRSNQT